MPAYQAPLHDMRFIAHYLQQQITKHCAPLAELFDLDLFQAIVVEADRFAQGMMQPSNRTADEFGAELRAGVVHTTPEWHALYQQFAESGWIGLALPEAHGGQGLPRSFARAVWEMWYSTNLAFSMLPQLNVAQAEALIATADSRWHQPWLEHIVSGRWAATMDLTEPQAGSDLAATTMRAEPQADGSYRLFGQKIYISFGEHELAENIVHLVLARLPDAPAGHRGLSLFLAPKYLVNEHGELGAKNDIVCVSIEDKLGIRGSPTCTLVYGDNHGASAYLVGEPNHGLAQMFVMMNEARQAVALQAVGVSEKAYQLARQFAGERVQGAVVEQKTTTALPIMHHPDVKRMLLELRATTFAMRALCYSLGAYADQLEHVTDTNQKERLTQLVDVLLPIAKGWCTEKASYNSALAVQVFGGMGYVEETGIAQVMRDARILPIFEGTTGIQAKDLLGRKLLRDQGQSVELLLQQIERSIAPLAQSPVLAASAELLQRAVDAGRISVHTLTTSPSSQYGLFAVSVPLLELLGVLSAAWQLAQLAVFADEAAIQAIEGREYCLGVQQLWLYFATHHLPTVHALAQVVQSGGTAVEQASFDWALI
ncbi:acyl-CoA dehydrogenase [Paenalcaligenes hominis]|uniref:acyl-CoA dehydrogenase n=1 Tax=Paenalcaligenes hominis TaxID=643674 RepID=UPI0035237F9A